MELIKLPYATGVIAVEKLKALGINPREKNGILSLEFTEEELGLIEELNINLPSPGCLNGLEHFHNLKKLTIENKSYHAYNNRNESISDKDIKSISKTTSLASLTIIGQDKISWVDVTDLVNLKILDIERNVNVDTIVGLDKLTNVTEFTAYGNKELYELTGIKDFINNNNLDILFLDLFNYPEVSDMRNKLLSIPQCDFFEPVSTRKDPHYNVSTMSLFHKKCLEIVQEIYSRGPVNPTELIVLVEQYLAEHITYDYEGLENDGNYHIKDGKNVGRASGTQCAYNGLMYGSCVCEGYTRSMMYLLKMLNIKSKNVSCVAGKNQIDIDDKYHNNVVLKSDGFHSIIRVEFQDSIYYCDPCWDSQLWQKGHKTLPYCLKNVKDISKNHTLSFEESNIAGTYSSVDPYQIESILKKCGIFEEKTSSER